ncbi:MAG: DNA polymerase III subunit delta [Endomicrobiia bacterium]
MGLITFAELNRKLEKKEISHLYYFYGEEIYLIEETLNKLEKIIPVRPEEKEIFYGQNINIDVFVTSLSSLSLFGEKKFIIIKESNKIKSATQEIISKYLPDIKESCYVVFITPIKIKKDELQKNEIIKEVSKTGEVVEFRELFTDECIKFIKEEFSKNGKYISHKNIETFLELTGNNLYDIKNEIEKIILFIGEKKEITVEDIYNCSGLTKQEDIYKLSDAIISGNVQTAISIFNNLLNSGTEISHILVSISKTLQQLLRANILINSKIPREEILKKLKMNIYFGNQLIDKSKKFTKEEILKKMEIIYKIELEMKSGRLENNNFSLFISDLCRN